MSDRPALTITEAAAACRVDRRTIRRRLDADELPGAYRADTPKGPGPWLIPVEALIAAGLTPNAPTPSPSTSAEPSKAAEGLGHDHAADLDRLRTENAELRRRAEVAEAIAAERADALADARIALRALTAGTPSTSEPTVPSPSTPRRRWWQR